MVSGPQSGRTPAFRRTCGARHDTPESCDALHTRWHVLACDNDCGYCETLLLEHGGTDASRVRTPPRLWRHDSVTHSSRGQISAQVS